MHYFSVPETPSVNVQPPRRKCQAIPETSELEEQIISKCGYPPSGKDASYLEQQPHKKIENNQQDNDIIKKLFETKMTTTKHNE